MTEEYVEQVRAAIRATDFHSPTTYSWFGRESPKLASRIRRAMTPATARNYLLHQLQSQLYTDFYIRGTASPRIWGEDAGALDPALFVAALSEANSGSGCCEDGWQVLGAANGEVAVRRNGITLWVAPEDLVGLDESAATPGARLKLRLPKDLPNISPGYYLVLSQKGGPVDESARLVRLYWNLKAQGAEAFVRTATQVLNGMDLFFTLKVLNDPRSYSRCDAAVIYLLQQDYLATARKFGVIYAEVAPFLKSGTPVFTKAIASGLGLAEDPGQTESFGQHRCRLLADGMICAYEQGARSLEARLRTVTERYARDGISLSRPYLGSGSQDVYTFEY